MLYNCPRLVHSRKMYFDISTRDVPCLAACVGEESKSLRIRIWSDVTAVTDPACSLALLCLWCHRTSAAEYEYILFSLTAVALIIIVVPALYPYSNLVIQLYRDNSCMRGLQSGLMHLNVYLGYALHGSRLEACSTHPSPCSYP